MLVKKDLKTYIIERIKVSKSNCWEWQKALSPCGYGVATWKGKYYRSHRLAYLAFKEEIPFDLIICHKCDNPSCCNPDHLFLGTNKDNSQDCSKKGRNTKGRRIPKKHTLETSKMCFEMWKSGISILDISKELNIHFTSVYWLVKRYANSSGFDFSQHVVKTNKERPKFLKITPEKALKVLSLRQDGKTFLEVSTETGVKLSTCKYICAHPDRLHDET